MEVVVNVFETALFCQGLIRLAEEILQLFQTSANHPPPPNLNIDDDNAHTSCSSWLVLQDFRLFKISLPNPCATSILTRGGGGFETTYLKKLQDFLLQLRLPPKETRTMCVHSIPVCRGLRIKNCMTLDPAPPPNVNNGTKRSHGTRFPRAPSAPELPLHRGVNQAR